MTRFVEYNSNFSTKRIYVDCKEEQEMIVPEICSARKIVAKIGIDHIGQNKFIVYPGQKIKVNDKVIFEEFVEDAESIRILLIGKTPFVIKYMDNPNINKEPDKKWIKNIDPIIKVEENIEGFEQFVNDTLNMSRMMGYDYLAVDYVQNKEKTICLELNIFPGLPDDEKIISESSKYWINKINDLIKN